MSPEAMRFRTLEELLSERDKLRRWITSVQKANPLVKEGIISEQDEAEMKQCLDEMLQHVEQEIAERTGNQPPAG